MQTKERNSNIELFRIIVMLFIIAHHYVVNSGIAECIYNSNVLSFKSFFLLIFGAFGKTGIDCFVLITGYFMCKSKITLKKFLKLIFEIIFYKVTIALIFHLTGYYKLSIGDFLYLLIPVTTINHDFTDAFLVFYLLIPFLNKLLMSLNEKQHILLTLLCVFTYVLMATAPWFEVDINYVSWFVVLYIISAYIRVYEKPIWNYKFFWGVFTIIVLILDIGSVILLTMRSFKSGFTFSYYFISDSNKILAVVTAISAFLFFKNLNIRKSKFINRISSTTFGILLIHANSDAMRRWLWKSFLNNVGMYDTRYIYLHAIGSCIGVFMICSLIDLIRIKLIEKPFFAFFEKHENDVIKKYKQFENLICDKLKISNDN